MAIPTPVNGQITDSVTQVNIEVVGSAPAQAMGSLYASLSHASGIAAQNAVNAQQQLFVAGEAVTTACVSKLLGDK